MPEWRRNAPLDLSLCYVPHACSAVCMQLARMPPSILLRCLWSANRLGGPPTGIAVAWMRAAGAAARAHLGHFSPEQEQLMAMAVQVRGRADNGGQGTRSQSLSFSNACVYWTTRSCIFLNHIPYIWRSANYRIVEADLESFSVSVMTWA